MLTCRLAVCITLLFAVAVPSLTEELLPLTLEALYSPDEAVRVDFEGKIPSAGKLLWLPDGSAAIVPDGDDGLWSVAAASGKRTPLFDRGRLAAAFAALPGLTSEDGQAMAKADQLQLSEDRQSALVNHSDDLFWVDLVAARARRLTRDPLAEVGEELSPDSRFASFIRGHDLFVVELESQRERRITAGGGAELLFGRLDWVYQEEIYGRGNFKGYWWSPDSSQIALLELDESKVYEFTVVDHIPNRLDLEVTNYPKAGDPNPTVRLGVVRAAGGGIQWVDTSRYAPSEHLIVHVGWTPDGSQVVFEVQDREQTWLDLCLADPTSGEVQVVLRETSPAWVERIGLPSWLDDGSFVWASERSGFRHLYHYAADGTLLRQLTDGEWEVRELAGVDQAAGQVFFTANLDDPIDVQLYRLALAGGTPLRLSQRAGTHRVVLSPQADRYLDRWSAFDSPPEIHLHDASGKQLSSIVAAPAAIGRYQLASMTRLQVAAKDGFPMEAMLLQPHDFDPNRKYPVLQYNYGGPHAPVVKNAWGGTRMLWHHLLAEQGIVLWMCDNRSASGKGMKPTWEIYQRMGEVELADIEAGLDWLVQQPWVDSSRLGIWGWSYGGFMASYALTHSQRFKVGIAGAPVTDWHLYDTIYTERYMRRPQNNPEGYARTSVVKAAGDLSGKLLLLHGTMDDNVHVQQSVQLIYELQNAAKSFDMMLYPKSRHGPKEKPLVFHLQRLMTDWLANNL